MSARRACFWMVVVALGIRLAVIPVLLPKRLNPEQNHWRFAYETGRIAQSIVEGHGFGSPLYTRTGPTAWLPPVYPYIVAGVFRLLGTYTKASAVALLFFNALTSSLTCLPIFFFTREGFGERTARWAGWAWAFCPYAIYFPDDRIWGTWLATLLLCVLFYFVLRMETVSSTLPWVGYGLLWGVAGLTDPVVLSVLPALGVWVCYRRHKRGLAWFAPNVAAALAFILMIAPWCVRNYRVFHEVIPIRDDFGLELHIGNNGDTSEWIPPMAGPWHNPAEWNEFVQRGELAYMAEKESQGWTYIRKHPVWFAGMFLRRAAYWWTGFWSLNRQYLADQPFDPPNIFLTTALSILALLGLRRAFLQGMPAAMPYALVLFFLPLVYFITHVGDYYRRPIDPMFVALAAYAIASWRRPSSRSVAPAIADDSL